MIIRFLTVKLTSRFVFRFANLPRKGPACEFAKTSGKLSLDRRRASVRNVGTISQFFTTSSCLVDCGRQTKDSVCCHCRHDSQRSVLLLEMKAARLERALLTTQQLCQACCGRVGDLYCDSLDCPVRFVLEKKRRDVVQMLHLRCVLEEKF